jgi:uncharacterized protein
MSIPVGAKAEKDQFFGRTRELDDLWGLFDKNHVVLSGPRRLGKTSLLQRLVDEAEARGWHAVLVDLEGPSTVEGMLSELERSLPDTAIVRWLERVKTKAGRAADRLRNVEINLPGGFGGGLELQPPPTTPWAEQAQRLQARLAPKPVLILVDEFSVFLEKLIARDRDNTEHLLAWLRTWRLASNVQCRFVFSGSIGINTLLIRHKLNTYFNDCYDFRLEAFSNPEATAMIGEELSRECRPFEKDVPDYLCDRVGWLSPYYVNLLLLESLRAARDRETEHKAATSPMSKADVDDGYERLLSVRSRFVHWAQRLERDLSSPDLAIAKKVLGAVATAPQGLTRRQLLARLNKVEPDPNLRAERLDRALWHLEEDGYLSTEGDRSRFLSFLLREYWRRNHGR